MKNSQQWIKQLHLEPHPEGGYYRRIYQGNAQIQTQTGIRASATAIHYLLEANDFSAWHRIQQDELWFFHAGVPLTIHQIDQQGKLHSHQLGFEHNINLTISGDTWFCAQLTPPYEPQDFSLVSCVVSPGFDFADFELGKAKELVNEYPQHEALIKRLCRE